MTWLEKMRNPGAWVLRWLRCPCGGLVDCVDSAGYAITRTCAHFFSTKYPHFVFFWGGGYDTQNTLNTQGAQSKIKARKIHAV